LCSLINIFGRYFSTEKSTIWTLRCTYLYMYWYAQPLFLATCHNWRILKIFKGFPTGVQLFGGGNKIWFINTSSLYCIVESRFTHFSIFFVVQCQRSKDEVRKHYVLFSCADIFHYSFTSFMFSRVFQV
jgi:hypothetical protein